MIADGYHHAARLVVCGRSAGGLLMGAVTNLRPDLFAAVLAGVPFMDVINTMLDSSIPLTAMEYEEWGDPDEPEQYAYMRGYSPYDNLATRRIRACWSRVGCTTRGCNTGSRPSMWPGCGCSRTNTAVE